jgi:hypothetical protein
MTPAEALALSPGDPAVHASLSISDGEIYYGSNPIVIVAVRPDCRYPDDPATEYGDPDRPAERDIPTATVDYRSAGEGVECVFTDDCSAIHLTEGDAIRAVQAELARHIARAGRYVGELEERAKAIEDTDHA